MSLRRHVNLKPKHNSLYNNFKNDINFEFNISPNEVVEMESMYVSVAFEVSYYNEDGAEAWEQSEFVRDSGNAPPNNNWTFSPAPSQAFFREGFMRLNDNEVSRAYEYQNTGYLNDLINLTPQKSRYDFSNNPIYPSKRWNNNNFDFSDFMNPAIGILDNAETQTLRTNHKLPFFITDDELPGNLRVQIRLTARREFGTTVLLYTDNPANFRGYVYNSDPEPDTPLANESYIRLAVSDLSLNYVARKIENPPKSLVSMKFEEIYTTTKPVTITGNKYKDHVEMPRNIDAFCVAFRSSLFSNTANGLVIYSHNSGLEDDARTLKTFQFKYGDGLLPLNKYELDLRPDIVSLGNRRDNNRAYMEFINQISEWNNGNGCLIDAVQWASNPLLFYNVKKPHGDMNNKLQIEMEFHANAPPNLELVIYGLFEKEAKFNYNDSSMISNITVEEEL